MKTIILFVVLCCAAMAQNIFGGPGDSKPFHGISISGTTTPTITNNSDQPLLGLIYQRFGGDMNPIVHSVEFGRIASGKLLQPGESTGQDGAYSMEGVFKRRMRRQDGTVVMEGPTTGYKILAVLLANGAFYSQATARDVKAHNRNGDPVTDSAVQDRLFKNLSEQITAIRAAAIGMQSQTAAERRAAINNALKRRPTPQASIDPGQDDRDQLALMLSQMNDDQVTAAVARIAALPDVVKGVE